jgi:hypothetical protein
MMVKEIFSQLLSSSSSSPPSSSSKIDENYLRNQVLKNADGEQQVEVNQRHLIDKILAR